MPLFGKKKPKAGKSDRGETSSSETKKSKPKPPQMSAGAGPHAEAEREDTEAKGNSEELGQSKRSKKQSKDRKVDGPQHARSRSRAQEDTPEEDDKKSEVVEEKKDREKEKKKKFKSTKLLRERYENLLRRVCAKKESDESQGTSAQADELDEDDELEGANKDDPRWANRPRLKSIMRRKKKKQKRPETTRVRLSPETIREVDRRERATTEIKKKDDEDDTSKTENDEEKHKSKDQHDDKDKEKEKNEDQEKKDED